MKFNFYHVLGYIFAILAIPLFFSEEHRWMGAVTMVMASLQFNIGDVKKLDERVKELEEMADL